MLNEFNKRHRDVMTIDETISYQLPTHWLPALINDDLTGLEPEDLEQLHSFSSGEIGGMRQQHFSFLNWEIVWDEPSFRKYHDGEPYGCLACDCVEVKAHFQKVG